MIDYKIAFDIDGVIANFHDVMRQGVLDEYDFDINNCKDKFHIDVPGMNGHDIFKMIIRLINDHGDDIKPYPGSREILQDFHERSGEPLLFVTARVGQNKRATWNWLQEHIGLPFSVDHVRSTEKVYHLYERDVTHFIDDRFKTCNLCAPHIPYTFLLSRSWNMGRHPAPKVRRIHSLRDATEHYLNASGCIKEI